MLSFSTKKIFSPVINTCTCTLNIPGVYIYIYISNHTYCLPEYTGKKIIIMISKYNVWEDATDDQKMG